MKQVNKSHYNFSEYTDKRRWASIWHQVDEICKLSPNTVLEIGPGPGTLKHIMHSLGINVQTVDLDPDLSPDYVASVTQLPIQNCSFDLVCAFQVLEHLPFESSIIAFSEMVRVAKKYVLISLPDAQNRFSICYENAKNIPGYITEKIFDSFFAGCIPIYWGANNIDKYVPKECFIDKRDFPTYDELFKYISTMSGKTIGEYLESIEKYLRSDDSEQFTSTYFANTIIKSIVGTR